MKRYQLGMYILGIGWLALGLWACMPDLRNTCDKHSDCVEGYLCDLERRQCLLCPDCRPCTGQAAECDDSNVCTDDSCPASGICEYDYNTSPCDDGVFCNGEDVCNGEGSCAHAGTPCGELGCDEEKDACVCSQHSDCAEEDYLCDLDQQLCVSCPNCLTCTGPEECDDDNVCTDEICPTSGICEYGFNTNSCDDGLFCNGEDVCDDQGNCAHTGNPCGGIGCNEEKDACEELAWDSIAAGEAHPCGLTIEGVAYCWGRDDSGQLGNGGESQDSQVPVAVDTSPIAGDKAFAQLTAGDYHTCGLTTQGLAYCWGRDDYGQLGNGGESQDSQIPVAVDTSPIAGDKTFTQLTAGGWHTCGLTTESVVYCWGRDNLGQLGDGSGSQDSQVPVAVDTSPIAGDKTFVQLTAGGWHTCGITTQGVAYCWGWDVSGQLGDGGESQDSQVPVAVDTSPIVGDKTFVQLTAGLWYTCGITTQGVAYCWGDDGNGQLGDGGERQNSQVPVAVDTSPIVGDKTFAHLTARDYHTCGITTQGVAYCWGRDDYGQLGDGGESQDSQVPVAVDTSSIAGDKAFVQLAAGSWYTCGITTQGLAYCWGRDDFGQLGDGGEKKNSQIPVAVDTTSTY